MLKAIGNSAYNIDDDVVQVDNNTNTSTCFTNCLKSTSFTVTTIDDEEVESDVETLIKDLTTSEKRLLFEPGKSKTSSIFLDQEEEEEEETRGEENEGFSLLLKEEEEEGEANKKMVLLSMESQNPYMDFKKSMEEMVEANQELKTNFEGLEELLRCYLRVNVKSNHGYIVGAFFDLLLGLAFDSSSSPSPTSTSVVSTSSCSTNDSCSSSSHGDIVSPLSFYTSSSSSSSSSSCDDSCISTPCVSSLELVEEREGEGEEEDEEQEDTHVSPCYLSSLDVKQ